jgi:hypothetical protein
MIDKDWCPCFLCGANATERHHAIEGNGRRQLSEKYGLVYDLCSNCHRTGNDSVHAHPAGYKAQEIKRSAQMRFENEYGTREDWIRMFGRNYL